MGERVGIVGSGVMVAPESRLPMDSIHVQASGLAIGDSAAVELGVLPLEFTYEPETPDSGDALLELAIDVDLGPLMRQLIVAIPPDDASDVSWFVTAAAVDIDTNRREKP